MSMLAWRELTLIGLASAWLALSGCAGTSASRADGAQLGFSLHLYVRDAEKRESYYIVEPGGTLKWGGGRDAMNRSTSWSGALEPIEIEQLRALLDQHDWFRHKPASTGEPKEQTYDMHLSRGMTVRTVRVRGRCKALEPIEKLLYGAALRRLEAEISALPRPDVIERERTEEPSDDASDDLP